MKMNPYKSLTGRPKKRFSCLRSLSGLSLLAFFGGLNMLSHAGEAHVVSATPFIDKTAPDCGLQKAMDSLGPDGGILEIPAGEYPLCRYLFVRSNVTLRGAGMEKTILTVGNPPHFSRILAKDDAAGTLTLENTEGLTPGMLMAIYPNGKATHYRHRLYSAILSVSNTTVTLENGTRKVRLLKDAYAIWGNQVRLAGDAAKGDVSIRVDLPALCKPNHAITLWGPGDTWNFHYNLIQSITGNVLTLQRPLTVSGKQGDVVSLNFSAITSEGQNHIGVEDLTIRGFVTESFTGPWTGFQAGGIHTLSTSGITLRNVDVRNWSGDGISIQGASNVLVSACSATGNDGHGFHPGTGMFKTRFEKLRSLRNTGDGFYYCWSNNGTDLFDSELRDNGGNGVGGLGNPHDRHCTIARNTIENNGMCGIEAYGGDPTGTGNVIHNNVIRDNSRSKPGAYPGIALYAIPSEPCLATRVESNIIENTRLPATQKIGIEERNAEPKEGSRTKADPVYNLFLSDSNTITGNTLKGHEIADIVITGPHSVVGDGQGQVQKRLPQPVVAK